MTQMLELVHKKFKTGIISMFKVLKENIVLMSKQVGNLRREINAVRKKQMKIPEIKNTNSKMKKLIG